jgi:hypothetical protein
MYGAAISTPTFTQFRIRQTCTNVNEQIVPIDLYIESLKKQKQYSEEQSIILLNSASVFDTKIREAEAIKIISDKPINQDPIPQPEPTPEPNPDPINSVPVGGDVKP